MTRVLTIFFNYPPTSSFSPPPRYSSGRYRNINGCSSSYKVEFHLKSLINNEIIVEQFDGSGNAVAFTMMVKCAGKLWEEASKSIGVRGKPSSTWRRLVSPYELSMTTTNGTLDTFHSNNITQGQEQRSACSYRGNWTTFRVSFQLDALTHGKARQRYQTFMRHMVNQKVVPRDPIRPGIKIQVIQPSSLVTTTLDHNQRFKRIPNFEVFYTLECFISSRRLNQINLTEVFYTTLCRLPASDAIEALKLVCFKEDVRVWNPVQELERVVQAQDYFGSGGMNSPYLRQRRNRKSTRIVQVYKALVTPTNIQF